MKKITKKESKLRFFVIQKLEIYLYFFQISFILFLIILIFHNKKNNRRIRYRK